MLFSAGVARTLAHILEQGQRNVLLPFARQLWPLALQLLRSDVANSSALSRYNQPFTPADIIFHTYLGSEGQG